jgi:hypothetical protein
LRSGYASFGADALYDGQRLPRVAVSPWMPIQQHEGNLLLEQKKASSPDIDRVGLQGCA